MAEFDSAIALALRLITKKGETSTLRRATSAAPPDTSKPWIKGATSFTDFATPAVWLRFKKGRIDGQLIRTGDQLVLIPASSLGVVVPDQVTDFLVREGGGSPLLTDLLGYWKHDETTGTRLDATANDNDALQTGGVTAAAAKINNGSEFNGTTQFLQAPGSTTLAPSGSFTVGGWFRLDQPSFPDGLISKWDTTAGRREWALWSRASVNRYEFRVSDDHAGTNVTVVQSPSPPTQFTYEFVVGWWDAVAQQISIQVNMGTIVSASHAFAVNSDATSPMDMGRIHLGSPAQNEFLLGGMDETFLYDRVVPQDELQDLYNGGNARQHPFTGTEERWTIVDVETLSPNGQLILHKVQVRRR